jgi:hypothetical protein
MRKQNLQDAAFDVATQVRVVEETIDAALAEVAELQARIMRANSVARVGYGAAHPTLERLAYAVTNLVATRGAMVDCHAELAAAKTKVPGLRAVMIGDGDECPPATGNVDLRIVA